MAVTAGLPHRNADCYMMMASREGDKREDTSKMDVHNPARARPLADTRVCLPLPNRGADADGATAPALTAVTATGAPGPPPDEAGIVTSADVTGASAVGSGSADTAASARVGSCRPKAAAAPAFTGATATGAPVALPIVGGTVTRADVTGASLVGSGRALMAASAAVPSCRAGAEDMAPAYIGATATGAQADAGPPEGGTVTRAAVIGASLVGSGRALTAASAGVASCRGAAEGPAARDWTGATVTGA